MTNDDRFEEIRKAEEAAELRRIAESEKALERAKLRIQRMRENLPKTDN